MKRFLAKLSLPALDKAFALRVVIVFFTVFSVATVAAIWLRGASETQSASMGARRFIVYLADGKVQGYAPPAVAAPVAAKLEPAKTPAPEAQKPAPDAVATKLAEPAAPEAVPEPVIESSADKEDVPALKPSTSPIAQVDETMIETIDKMRLPKLGAANQKPWVVYSRFYKRPDENPIVAIIITGLGQNAKATEYALKMDENITLSFSPYARKAESWVNASRITGHEAFADLALQPEGFPNDDPGTHALLVSRNNTDNVKNLLWGLSRFQGYAGAITPVNEVLSNNADAFKPLVEEMAKRGIMLVLGRDITQKDSKELLKMEGLDAKVADVWIDEELNDFTMQARLATLEQIAHKRGYAVGVASGYMITLKQIEQWKKNLAEHKVNLAPVTYIQKLHSK